MMIKLLDDYVSRAIAGGFTVEKYGAVSNPCVNFALDFAEKMLTEAQESGCAAVENLSIEVNGRWQMLYIDLKTVGFDEWIEAIEKRFEASFTRQLGC